MSFTPSCIWRLPPVNWLLFRNRSDVTLEYVVLNALLTVPISTPLWKTVGWASEKLRWLKILKVSTRNCSVVPSDSLVFLAMLMFQVFTPRVSRLLRPTVGWAPSSAWTYRASGFWATEPATVLLPPGQPAENGAILVVPPAPAQTKSTADPT